MYFFFKKRVRLRGCIFEIKYYYMKIEVEWLGKMVLLLYVCF